MPGAGRRDTPHRLRGRGFCLSVHRAPERSLGARPPPFPPAAERWPLMDVPSAIEIIGGSSQAAKAANKVCHSPRWLQRLNRLNTVVRVPYAEGSARQRSPSRHRCEILLITRRSSTRGFSPKCGNSPSIAAHCRSLNQKSYYIAHALLESLNQICHD